MAKEKRNELALFFTRGVSLQTWVSSGLFYREKLLYEAHLNAGHFDRVVWFTYGALDAQLAETLKQSGDLHSNIDVVPMPKCFTSTLGIWVYSLFMPIIHYKLLGSMRWIKTNQVDGAWSACIAKLLQPSVVLVVRSGYLASVFVSQEQSGSWKQRVFTWIEVIAYRIAAVGFVSNANDHSVLSARISTASIFVLPNFIDTSRIRTKLLLNNHRWVCVGRLVNQKNLFNLIQAAHDQGIELDIYGAGPLKQALEAVIQQQGSFVRLMGVVANHDLPNILIQYRYFILPSQFEGMPKALLEAMASGRVCVGTDVVGIRDIICDGQTGVLAKDTSVEAIALAIARTRAYPSDKQQIMATAAVQHIHDHYALDRIVHHEWAHLRAL
jgi:glycosyltransferase involved in cell wall biosynthesis